MHFIHTLSSVRLVSEDAGFRERLHAVPDNENGDLELYTKLWCKTQVTADRDPETKSVYLLIT